MRVRLPSVKRLSAVFGAGAKRARQILEMTREELDALPEGIARNRECYNRPETYDVRLHCLAVLGEHHGLESFQRADGRYVDYFNTGEVYSETLIYDGKYRIVVLGDYVEKHRSERCRLTTRRTTAGGPKRG